MSLKVPDGFLLEEILWQFPTQALGSALVAAGLPADGRKVDRISRLVVAGRERGVPAGAVLDLFKAESLRKVCTIVRVSATTKDEMVHGVVATLIADDRVLSSAAPGRHPPTRETVLEVLRENALPPWAARDEASSEQAIGFLLRKLFAEVTHQVSVGGFAGDRIDIDLGGGQVGVEVKLAKAINESASEAYRAIGQAVIYRQVCYFQSLVVAIVGGRQDFDQSAALGVANLLEGLGFGVAVMLAE